MTTLKNCLACSYFPVVVFTPNISLYSVLHVLCCCTNNCESLHTWVYCDYLPHHTHVDYSSHVGKSLATCANLLPYLWPVLYRQQVLDHLIESLPNTSTCTSHLPYTWTLWGSTCTRIQGLSRRTIIHVHKKQYIYVPPLIPAPSMPGGGGSSLPGGRGSDSIPETRQEHMHIHVHIKTCTFNQYHTLLLYRWWSPLGLDGN